MLRPVSDKAGTPPSAIKMHGPDFAVLIRYGRERGGQWIITTGQRQG